MPIYAQELDPWLRASRGIGTMIAQRPVLAAQRAQLAQRQELYGAQSEAAKAHGELYRSQAGKFDAETANLIRLGQAVTFLQEHGGEAEKALANGDVNNPIVDKVHGAMQAVAGMKGKSLSTEEKTTIGTMLATQGRTYAAGAVENPAKVTGDETAAIAKTQAAQIGADERAKRPVVIPRNGTLASNTGQVLTTGTQDVGMGHRLFAQPGVQVQAVAEGNAAPPKSSAIQSERAKFLASTMKALQTPGIVPKGQALGDAVAEQMRIYDEAAGTEEQPAAASAPATPAVTPIPTTPAPAVVQPAAAKVVIQNGHRFQLNPDGSAVHLGPIQ